MKKMLLSLATVITITSVGTSLYLATQPNPTDLQKQICTTAITIANTWGVAIFESLDKQNKDGGDQNEDHKDS